MKKADLKAFLNKTERILLDAQFKRTVESDRTYDYEWIKDTCFGTLLLNVDNDNSSRVYSIFGRFKDPDRAKYILLRFNGNTYSGKCNTHTFEQDEAIRQLQHLIIAVS